MSDFLERMKKAAKSSKKTIVLPEGEDPRTIEAAKKIVAEGLANLVILGDPDKIDVEGVTVIDPRNAEKHDEYAAAFAELRKKKGVTLPEAMEQMNDATYFGTMMVKMGDADGLVSGACHSTANTLRPGAADPEDRPGTKLVSAFFIMCTDKAEYGDDGTLLFADCGLNIDPRRTGCPRSPSRPRDRGRSTWAPSRRWLCCPSPPWAPPRARCRPRSRRRPSSPTRRPPSSPSTATCSSTPRSCRPSPR